VRAALNAEEAPQKFAEPVDRAELVEVFTEELVDSVVQAREAVRALRQAERLFAATGSTGGGRPAGGSRRAWRPRPDRTVRSLLGAATPG
jgi:hypothetical protein